MKRNLFFIILIISTIVPLTACGGGNKFPPLGTINNDYKLLDAPQIAIAPAGYSGKNIRIILRFDTERVSEKEFYKLLVMSSGAPFFVYLNTGKYPKQFDALKPGKEYMIYGRFERDMVMQRNAIYVD